MISPGGIFFQHGPAKQPKQEEEQSMTELLEKYFSVKKKSYVIAIIAAVIVAVLVKLILKPLSWGDYIDDLLFFEPFVLFFIIWQCQLNLSEKKQAVIREVTKRVAHKFEMQCKDPGLWDEEQCKASLLFKPSVEAFYLDRDIPHQIFTLEKQGVILQYSHVSYGTVSSKVKKVGKRYVVHGRSVNFYIMSTGLLFRCYFPCHFSDSWLLLPKEWGKHLQKITPMRFFLADLAKAPLPSNFSLFKNENDALWIYSTAGSAQEAGAATLEEGAFAEKCYAPLREKPYSLMSFTGKNMYVYIPFEWKMRSEEELEACVAEYKADIELVRKIVFDNVMPKCYEKQFAAMNGEQM